MARTVITPTAAPGGFPLAGTVVTLTAADSSNNNAFVCTGREVLLVTNVHASAAKTFTVNTQTNSRKRSADITAQSLAAGAFVVLGTFTRKEGWVQADGTIHCTGEDNNIKFAVITLP